MTENGNRVYTPIVSKPHFWHSHPIEQALGEGLNFLLPPVLLTYEH